MTLGAIKCLRSQRNGAFCAELPSFFHFGGDHPGDSEQCFCLEGLGLLPGHGGTTG